MYCSKCGAQLPDGTAFCSSCGAATSGRAPDQSAATPAAVPPNSAQPAGSMPPPYAGFVCPYCRYQGAPIIERKLSSNGWILFVVLLIVFFPLCWLPFVIDGCKENVRICPSCRARMS
jgi:lipopolysaccharide-induced tumor necrosis factor-alpha factor